VKIDFTIIHIFITKTNVYIEKEITNKCLIDNLFWLFFLFYRTLYNTLYFSLLFYISNLQYKLLTKILMCTYYISYIVWLCNGICNIFAHFTSPFPYVCFLGLAKWWHPGPQNNKCQKYLDTFQKSKISNKTKSVMLMNIL